MLLKNLHRHNLYKVIRLLKIKDLEQRIPTTTGIKGQLHYGFREKRAIPVMVILQAGAAIGGTLIKG